MKLIRYVMTYVRPRWRWRGYRRGSRRTFGLIVEALGQYWYDYCASRLEKPRGTRTTYRSGWSEVGPYETESDARFALPPHSTSLAVERCSDGWYIQYFVNISTSLPRDVEWTHWLCK